ncbi:putative signal transducing protein [Egicoccus sp. AB-alg6-2]|uniref:putative signal transducing protein n=1 Tax=Egicoccus sp. AB-alg6-2 TaxID=3242692 RepID=UPI00359D8103
MARIDRFTSRTEAELARAVLEANGIHAYVSGDDAGGLHPELPYGIGGTAVVVSDDHYADAIALLDHEYGADPADAAALETEALASGGEVRDDVRSRDTADAGTAPRSNWRPAVVVLLVVTLVVAVLATDAISTLLG